MLGLTSFIDCIREQLKEKRYGKERADAIVQDFTNRAKAHMNAGRGETDAALMAMRDTFDNLSKIAEEKAKRNTKTLAVQASNLARAQQAMDINMGLLKNAGTKNRGEALARAAISTIEADPRFSGNNFTTLRLTTRGQLFALMGDTLEKIGKGAFGRQLGKAHLPNIIREVFGETTKDALAKDIARAWLKVSDTAVDLFNQAGGSMNKLQRYLPQTRSITKVIKNGGVNGADFIKQHMSWVDWDRTRWPDGSIIQPEDRTDVLKRVYDTFASDGALHIDPTAFRGQGRSVGNMLDNNRFLHYKDADSWLAAHEAYGEGNEIDVLFHHVDAMSHKIAMVDTFGPNPEAARSNWHATVRNMAAKVGPQERMAAEAMMKNKFDPMFDTIMRRNPMNPESFMGSMVTGVSNLLTSAQLGSSALLAIPGDWMQTVAVRALNHMPLFDGMGFYFKSLATDKDFMREIAAQSGFVHDEAVMQNYAHARFGLLQEFGPQVTKRISDTVMRASLLSGHTASGRWTAQAEMMGLFKRYAQTEFDKLPFNNVMDRYAITAKDWDTFRNNVAHWSPQEGTNFLRPIDILNTKFPKIDGEPAVDAQGLYNKFQGMILQESRYMVPESTIEAATMLKGTTRPDTMLGAILHSFAMYKNFPLSFWHIYGRLAMTSPTVTGRLGFVAGLGAAMTMMGAVGTQMREVAQGRDPMPMNTPEFLAKAFLAGGAMSIYGDFLFSGINTQTGGPTQTAAGPLIGWAGDTAQLVLGKPFKFVNAVGSLDRGDKSTPWAEQAIQYAKRYTPGSNIWWSRLALERQVWDRMEELADPKIYAKRRAQEQKQMQQYGNGYWSPPGSRSYERLPQYQGR